MINDKYIFDLVLRHGSRSKDPSTQVGALIVSYDGLFLSSGCNSFSDGLVDLDSRWADRDMKLKLVVHAEMNAILLAAKHGVSLNGSTLYVLARDTVSKEIWGGPPCTRCTVELIQAGIKEVVGGTINNLPERWKESCLFSKQLLEEAGVRYREFDYNNASNS